MNKPKQESHVYTQPPLYDKYTWPHKASENKYFPVMVCVKHLCIRLLIVWNV